MVDKCRVFETLQNSRCAVLTNLNHADSVLSGSETCMYNQASIIRSVRSSIPAGGPIVYDDYIFLNCFRHESLHV